MKKLFLIFFLITSSFNFVSACSIAPLPSDPRFFGEHERLLNNLKSDYINKINSPFTFFEIPDLERSTMGSDFDLKFLSFKHEALKNSSSWIFILSSGGNCFPMVLYMKTYLIPFFIVISLMLFLFLRKKKNLEIVKV